MRTAKLQERPSINIVHTCLTQISAYINAHPHVGLLFAFLIAFAESLPILGTVIPGSVTMTAIGILIGQNLLPFQETLFLAIVGALTGDAMGYWLGKHYQDRLETHWPFRRYPKIVVMGRHFFTKHGGKSIIFGRFIGPTRSAIPLIAGLLKMKTTHFILAVIPSAILWAFIYLLPGILIGFASLALPKGKATSFTLIGLGGIFLIWLIVWGIQRVFVFLAVYMNRITDRCWSWLRQHHGTRLLIRLLTNKQRPDDPYQLTLLFFVLLLFFSFCGIFYSVVAQYGIYHLNAPIFHFLQTVRFPLVNYFFAAVTELGETRVIGVISGLVLIYAGIRRQWYIAIHIFIIFALAVCSITLIKQVYYSPRPSGFLVPNLNSSFPSGHTLLTTSVIGFFAFLSGCCLPKRWKWMPYAGWIIVTCLVASSRLVLGAHWFCDILGGMTLGLALLLLTIITYRRQQPIITRPYEWLSVIIGAITIAWGCAGHYHLHHNLYRYTPYFQNETVRLDTWWENDSMGYIPIYRLDRLGQPTQPFNIEWAGDLEEIERTLQTAGWESVESRKPLKQFLSRFISTKPEEHMAFFAQLYHQKPPVLLMIRRIKNQPMIIELRLWETKIHFTNSPLSLFVGSINYHLPAELTLRFKSHLQITLRNGGGTQELCQSLGKYFISKKILLEETQLPDKIKQVDWDKKILLIKPK